jgi:hypothetical protein
MAGTALRNRLRFDAIFMAKQAARRWRSQKIPENDLNLFK